MAYHTASSFGFVDIHSMSDGCRQVICAAQARKRVIPTVWPQSASEKDINTAPQPGMQAWAMMSDMPAAPGTGSTNVDTSLPEGLAASPSIRSSAWKF